MNRIVLKQVADKTLPAPIHRWLGGLVQGDRYCPPPGRVDFGSFRRLSPVSRFFGYDRGRPIDRYYIEKFLEHHAIDIRGRVLEIGDNAYTRRFGAHRVAISEVLHVEDGNPDTTIVGDLSDADHIPSNTFDCFILTQTLQLIYDLPTTIETIHRILKPGGTALVTVPGSIAPIHDQEWQKDWCWGFTPLSAEQLFTPVFDSANIQVTPFGNVLAAIAFLQGIAAEELQQQELDRYDAGYPLLIAIRVIKPEASTDEIP